MLRLIAGLFLGASAVLASNVPVFSSNDDYDEINLNIRLLEAHAKSNDTSTMPKVVVTVTIPMTVTCATGTSCTAKTFQDSTSFTTGVCDSVKTAGGAAASTPCDVTVTESASRARQLTTTLSLSVSVALTVTAATLAAVESLAAAVEAAITSSTTLAA